MHCRRVHYSVVQLCYVTLRPGVQCASADDVAVILFLLLDLNLNLFLPVLFFLSLCALLYFFYTHVKYTLIFGISLLTQTKGSRNALLLETSRLSL